MTVSAVLDPISADGDYGILGPVRTREVDSWLRSHLSHGNVLHKYEGWPHPAAIVSDGAYGVDGGRGGHLVLAGHLGLPAPPEQSIARNRGEDHPPMPQTHRRDRTAPPCRRRHDRGLSGVTRGSGRGWAQVAQYPKLNRTWITMAAATDRLSPMTIGTCQRRTIRYSPG